jgi:hypothetical protein
LDSKNEVIVCNGANRSTAAGKAVASLIEQQGCDMPTELPKRREREPTDLERYGYWQHGLMFFGLLFLGVVIAMWFWGG